jgi:hypothetical protein
VSDELAPGIAVQEADGSFGFIRLGSSCPSAACPSGPTFSSFSGQAKELLHAIHAGDANAIAELPSHGVGGWA